MLLAIVAALLVLWCGEGTEMRSLKKVSAAFKVVPAVPSSLTESEWLTAASEHKEQLQNLLYPKCVSPGGKEVTKQSIKSRMHNVSKNPIYNFLHTYYR
jgi:hypothetical protein